MKPFIKARFVVVLLCGLISGCASNQSLFYWGSYQQVVLSSYTETGHMDVATKVDKLTTTISQARERGQKIAPGVYGYLALLYAEQGLAAKSIEALQMEKELFPESARFVDGLIERAKL